MRLEQRDKEFTAIGASIGANCRPCIEHHIEAARTAGLSPDEVVESVAMLARCAIRRSSCSRRGSTNSSAAALPQR